MKAMVKLLMLGCSLLIWTALPASGDEPTAPPLPPDHGANGNQGPAGAPIDGGLGILLALGTIYGSKKYLQLKKRTKENTADAEAGHSQAGSTDHNAV